MGFLLKVKRAKFVLGKARRWMWKVRYFFNHSYKKYDNRNRVTKEQTSDHESWKSHFVLSFLFDLYLILCFASSRVEALQRTIASTIGCWNRNSSILWMLSTSMWWTEYAIPQYYSNVLLSWFMFVHVCDFHTLYFLFGYFIKLLVPLFVLIQAYELLRSLI